MTIRMSQEEIFEACAAWLRERGADVQDNNVDLMKVELQMNGKIVLTFAGCPERNVEGPYR